MDRRAEIIIEPLYPRGRLLGGSPAEGSQKVSKLAALAAARKKKENTEAASTTSKLQSSTSVALLDKLSGNHKPDESVAKRSMEFGHRLQSSPLRDEARPLGMQTRKYPTRKRKSPSPPRIDQTPIEEDPDPIDVEPLSLAPILNSPSPFAHTMLGPSSLFREPSRKCPVSFSTFFSPVYAPEGNLAKSNPFAGPSPDDIVANAQNSKGSKQSKKGT